MDKVTIRNEMRARRANFPEKDRDAANRLIQKQIGEWLATLPVGRIYSYLERGGEVQVSGILAETIRQGWQAYAPATGSRQQPTLVSLVQDGTKLVSHKEFAGEQLQEMVSSIDVFIVPAIAWDLTGYRVGFGGGFFDRLLSMADEKAARCGAGFQFQVLDRVPHDSWDIPVHWLFTEKGAYSCGKADFLIPPVNLL